MRDLIVSGHGAWNQRIEPTHVKLGPGQRVKFYQEPLHLLADARGRALESLIPAALDQPVRTYEPGELCPNFSINPPFGLDIVRIPPDDPTYRQLVPDREVRLSEITADADYISCTIYWAACLAVKLHMIGGNAVGVNTGWDGTNRSARESAMVPSADIEQQVRISEDYHESTALSLYVDVLARHAFPSGAIPPDSLLTVLVFLAQAAGEGAVELAEAFVDKLTPEDRRAFLLNDTFRWWLAENGLRIPGEITESVLTIQNPGFWLPSVAKPATAAVLQRLTEGNTRALDGLQPNKPVQLAVTPGGLVLVGGEHPEAVIEYVVADPGHAFCEICLTEVDDHRHLVVVGCPNDLQGPVYQALTNLGWESVWFDEAPGAVVDVETWDWDDLAERNRTVLANLWRGQEVPFVADDAVVLLHPQQHFSAEEVARVHALGGAYQGVFRSNIFTGYDVHGCPPDRREAFTVNMDLAGVPAEKLQFTD